MLLILTKLPVVACPKLHNYNDAFPPLICASTATFMTVTNTNLFYQVLDQALKRFQESRQVHAAITFLSQEETVQAYLFHSLTPSQLGRVTKCIYDLTC